MTAPALALQGIRKRFGTVVALDGVDLEVLPGTTHALLGENGAGKSTLLGVIAGLIGADAGTMTREGRSYRPRDPRDARSAGIGLVHQHFTTIAELKVWENLALAAGWPLAGARDRAEAHLREHGVAIDVDALVRTLGVGGRQQVELQKALVQHPKLLLLDEPTGVLTPPEVDELFRVVREFTTRGGAVVLITHKLDEAIAHADAGTVLRQGAVTFAWGQGRSPTSPQLVAAMIGREVGAPPPKSGQGNVGVVVATNGHVDLKSGEMVGVAGVEGNGQREFLRGFDTTAFVPEDRTTEGTIGEFTLAENLALRPDLISGPSWRIDWRGVEARMSRLIVDFAIKAGDARVPLATLSGGNQQKVVVARALEGAPRLVVAENPARGLDVGAAREIFLRLRAAADAGAAVIFSSTDLDEVMDWSDRIVVLAAGEVRIPPAGADRSAVGALMVSGTTK